MAQLLSFKSLQGELNEATSDHTLKPPDQYSEELCQIVGTTNQANSADNIRLSDKQQQSDHQSANATPASLRQARRASSPATPVPGARTNKSLFDGVSTVSKSSLSGIRSASALDNSSKHFELRWRNIDLRTKAKGNFIQDLLGGRGATDRYENTGSNELVADDGTRQILSNLSGTLYSGQLTAILGPSGVGKTTLLNCFTGHNTLEGTGRVSVIGGSNKNFAVCTIPQEDILPQQLTVKEDLYFASKIKNPHPGFDHDKNVARVTRLLQIGKCFETRISKLSGGEARRLSIARELLSNPDVMILDEPTSGLDASTCWKIISALKSLVEHSDNELDRPMAMIVTIHQPQRELLNLFHRIYVMAQGGRTIFEGPPSSLMSVMVDQCDLLKRARRLGASARRALNENPAVVAIEVASGEYGQEVIKDLADYHTQQTMEQPAYYGDESGSLAGGTPRSLRPARPSPLSVSPRFAAWRYEHNLEPQAQLQQQQQQQQQQPDYVSAVTSMTYFSSASDQTMALNYGKVKVDRRLRRGAMLKSHYWRHTMTLIERTWILTRRNLFLMLVRVVGFVMVAAGIVQIYAGALNKDAHLCPSYYTEVDDVGQLLRNSLQRIANETVQHLTQTRSTHTFFFHSVLCIMMVTSALTGLVFPLQMKMFLRERKNGWYSLASFVTSNTLAELPTDMLGPIVTMTIMYPLCQQPDSYLHWRFFAYTFTCIMVCLMCKSQSQIVSAFLLDSVENSVFASCVMVAPQALLSGIAVRVADMYPFLQYLSYGFFLRYGFDSLFILRYGFGLCPCDPNQVTGYPARPTEDAVPVQLENLANGLIDLTTNHSLRSLDDTPPHSALASDSALASGSAMSADGRLFNVIVQLLSGANNMFVPNRDQLGSCDTYRSLYLVERDQRDSDLVPWLVILVAMFVGSRFVTYYVLLFVMRFQCR